MSSPTLTLDRPVARAAAADTTPLVRRPLLRILGLASITVAFLAGSSAPTPLYATYQKAWGFSTLTTTVVFGVYALSFLLALLIVGRLSDHVGRKPLLLGGITGQIIAMLVFVHVGSVPVLITGRVIQGLAAGSAVGAVGAAMLDIHGETGAVANGTAPGLGSATGALGSAFLIQWLPWPTHLVYLVLLGVFVTQGAWVLGIAETSPRKPGALRSLIPQVTVPPATRRAVLTGGPVLFALWALTGFYGSLSPALTRHLITSTAVVWTGVPLGLLAGVGALTTFVLRHTLARRVLGIGVASLIVGTLTVLASARYDSAALLLIGSGIAGIGFGAGFQGAIRLVVPLAQPDERAGVLSVLFIISYLAFGAPAIGAGVALTEGVGLISAIDVYGLAVVTLSALAGLNLLRRPAKVR